MHGRVALAYWLVRKVPRTRRALADALNEAGGSDGALMRVASMLGHSDVRVTQKYIGWEAERRARNEAVAGKVMFPAMTRPAALALARREA